jgi:hypothetical protein
MLAEQVGGSCVLAGSGQEGQDLADGARSRLSVPGSGRWALIWERLRRPSSCLAIYPVWVRSMTMP